MAGFEDQPARVLVDWSEIGAAPPVDDTPSASKEADKSVAVAVSAPTVKDDAAEGGGKIAVTTVAADTVTAAVSNLADTARREATDAAKPAGEIVVAEVKITAALPQDTSVGEVTEAVIEIPKTAVAAVVAEAVGAESKNVEIVLTVESALASGTASVTLDALTLVQLANTAAESATVSVALKEAVDKETLPFAQASAIPADKAPFSVEILIGDTQLTDLASEIAVTIPYVKQGGTDKKVVLWYVPAAGSKEKVEGAVYDAGKLTFTTDRI
jgi:hypothetical protein